MMWRAWSRFRVGCPRKKGPIGAGRAIGPWKIAGKRPQPFNDFMFAGPLTVEFTRRRRPLRRMNPVASFWL